MQELEVSATQAHSLPVADLDHPLLGKMVVVKYRPQKGYRGYIRAAGNTTVTVELNALYTSSVLPLQEFAWEHIRLMYVHATSLNIWHVLFLLRSAEEQTSRTNPDPRARMPEPSPTCEPPQASTPEPKGSMSPLPRAFMWVD
jgi:hypothetical protein